MSFQSSLTVSLLITTTLPRTKKKKKSPSLPGQKRPFFFRSPSSAFSCLKYQKGRNFNFFGSPMCGHPLPAPQKSINLRSSHHKNTSIYMASYHLANFWNCSNKITIDMPKDEDKKVAFSRTAVKVSNFMWLPQFAYDSEILNIKSYLPIFRNASINAAIFTHIQL